MDSSIVPGIYDEAFRESRRGSCRHRVCDGGDKYMSTAMWRERREGSGSEQMDTPEEG